MPLICAAVADRSRSSGGLRVSPSVGVLHKNGPMIGYDDGDTAETGVGKHSPCSTSTSIFLGKKGLQKFNKHGCSCKSKRNPTRSFRAYTCFLCTFYVYMKVKLWERLSTSNRANAGSAGSPVERISPRTKDAAGAYGRRASTELRSIQFVVCSPKQGGAVVVADGMAQIKVVSFGLDVGATSRSRMVSRL